VDGFAVGVVVETGGQILRGHGVGHRQEGASVVFRRSRVEGKTSRERSSIGNQAPSPHTFRHAFATHLLGYKA
jgi:integrase